MGISLGQQLVHLHSLNTFKAFGEFKRLLIFALYQPWILAPHFHTLPKVEVHGALNERIRVLVKL